jgi:hypothetical protein
MDYDDDLAVDFDMDDEMGLEEAAIIKAPSSESLFEHIDFYFMEVKECPNKTKHHDH